MIIKQINQSDLIFAAEVIRESFATVAKEFNITEQNCPNYTGFITIEKLQNHYICV